MITDEIFEELRKVDRGLTESEFCKSYLRTSRSYLCNRRNKRKDVSNDVLLRLYAELSGAGAVWRRAADTEHNAVHSMRWVALSEFHTQLAKKVLARLVDRAKQEC